MHCPIVQKSKLLREVKSRVSRHTVGKGLRGFPNQILSGTPMASPNPGSSQPHTSGVPKRPPGSGVLVAKGWCGGRGWAPRGPAGSGPARRRHLPSPARLPVCKSLLCLGGGPARAASGRGEVPPRSPGGGSPGCGAARAGEIARPVRRRPGSSGRAGGGDPGFAGGPAGAHARSLGGRWSRPRLGQDGEPGAHALR